MIRWLLENGYVGHPERGVYFIIEKERALLKSIRTCDFIPYFYPQTPNQHLRSARVVEM